MEIFDKILDQVERGLRDEPELVVGGDADDAGAPGDGHRRRRGIALQACGLEEPDLDAERVEPPPRMDGVDVDV